MITTMETFRCEPLVSVGFAANVGAFAAYSAHLLPSPDFMSSQGMAAGFFAGAVALVGRMAESTMAGDRIRTYGFTPPKLSARRARCIANVVMGEGAYQLRDGRWKPRIWTDTEGTVVIKGSVVDEV